MATYDLRDRGQIPRLVKGDIIVLPARHGYAGRYGIEGDYGGSFSIDLPKGRYLLEVWGSAASRQVPENADISTLYPAATGGYAKGVLRLGQKTTTILTAGGVSFNGGEEEGRFSDTGYQTGSGGASDIRLIRNDLLYRVIVAGGGGVGSFYKGGNGGGPLGADGEGPNGGKGGTQTSGGVTGTGYDESNHWKSNGTFGQGGGWYGNYATNMPGQGGGGWYGGGGGGIANIGPESVGSGGGGGSGFVLTAGTAGNTPNGYGLGSSYYLTDTVNITGHETGTPITNPDGTITKGHFGEGYVRITILDIFNGVYIGSTSGRALAVKDIYIGDSNNKARRVIKGYIGDANGKARRFL